ncbi:MAG: C40 family peptidase [Bacteroides sp.]|nr:C40 family peptidase [Bacteroides sp.]
MKLRTLFTTIILASCGLIASAQTSEKTLSAHQRLHQQQLANVNSKLDKSVISDMLKEDVAKREASNSSALSSESSQLINDLLVEANKHIGKPYVHGAKGPSRFDCSGFSSYVYKQFGYNISPSSRTQYTEGVKVERNDLQKGDLVFFTSRSSGKNVGHVGIVVSADNKTGKFKFIHASIKGVKISDFDGYYVPRYIGARRIITK